ncbi:MAG: HPP family protein [Planctomycetes bacterium]|nr:HPP family protein [Planctomycetota bacterium]
MRIFDRKFHKHVGRYLFQCALATGAVLVILLVLDVITQAVIIASLGASSFIAFTMPHANVSRPRYMIGGYVWGMVAGIAMNALGDAVGDPALGGWTLRGDVIFGAASVGLAIFLMVITDTEHPPAAGLALGVVLAQWNTLALVVPIVGIVALSLARLALKPILINLIDVPEREVKHESR